MFGLSFLEIVLIVIVAFLVFGPERFPEVVRTVARTLRNLKIMAQNAQSEFMDVTRDLREPLNTLHESSHDSHSTDIVDAELKDDTVHHHAQEPPEGTESMEGDVLPHEKNDSEGDAESTSKTHDEDMKVDGGHSVDFASRQRDVDDHGSDITDGLEGGEDEDAQDEREGKDR